MSTYIVFVRGINVGGKNKVSMAGLKKCLEELGYSDVSTFLSSGNVILESDKPAAKIKAQIEKALPENFKLDDELIKVLVLTRRKFQSVVNNRPKGFGDEPEKYYSDAIFLMGISVTKAMTAFDPLEGVDTVWPGSGVIYSQRLSSKRTKSHLSKIAVSPAYKSMTIRSWSTTMKLLEILKKTDQKSGE